ncbi:hypothetical protein OG930_03145 [Streptomyces sp. NBC_01799]|uniref:hypothetical protein n=1 Tax=Streptomyces sp. NBC_01800 TaxID=2975945 RepID=UPI002DD83BD2|nr:hypothetical protein [Streptomyces sp. NBC_01800]WSA66091.1 hypothetical protein OIE65_03220 [Streptomyces sp. NBC_01800]WSA74692.1 hypothetical protein OG930_03145 [Streptomyces sp. NBC_01799]
MTRAQLTDEAREFIELHVPMGRYGSYPARAHHDAAGLHLRASTIWIKELTRTTL